MWQHFSVSNMYKLHYRFFTTYSRVPVPFTAMGEVYRLITNRFDLTTYQIIMLYAYRWQVELCFRFLKRTLTGIHLLCHDSRGIQIQFYLYLIAYLLLLSFKQKVELIVGNEKSQDKSDEYLNSANDSCSDDIHRGKRFYARGLVSILGEKLQLYWKISIHWLTAVKNLLLSIFDVNTAHIISNY